MNMYITFTCNNNKFNDNIKLKIYNIIYKLNLDIWLMIQQYCVNFYNSYTSPKFSIDYTCTKMYKYR